MELEQLLINENMSVLQAMKVLDSTAQKVLLITDANVLKAVLTDGDIRRHIINGGSLEQPVSKVANYCPKFVYEEKRMDAKQIMAEKKVHSLPVVDAKMKVISIVFRDDLEVKRYTHIALPVVIMAGGLGTRLYPYTKILPKPLIPIGDLPIVEHIINRFVRCGCNDFHLIVNHKKNMIKSYFSETNHTYRLNFVDEEKPLGTGGGLSLLKGKLDEPFFLSNSDILIDANLKSIYRLHREQNNIITIVCAFKHMTVPYGVVELSGNGRIKAISEKPQYSFLTNTGMYLVEPRVVEEMKDGEAINFPDIINRYRDVGDNVGVYPINEKCWFDMGQIEELEEMRKALGV